MTTLRIIPDKDSFAHAERELGRLAGKSVNLPGLLYQYRRCVGLKYKEALPRKTRPRRESLGTTAVGEARPAFCS